VSPELFSVAIHHLETLRKLEVKAVERSKGTATDRTLVDEDLRDATAKATILRDQAYGALRDAGQTRRRGLEVDEAFGVADPPEKLAAGLDAMSRLLLDWLGSDDDALRTRLALASLDKSFAAELSEGALALTTALVAANKRNSQKARQAELDREDGVQILLLGQIIRAFESAHDRSRTIPRLVPISTRRLFNRNKKSATAPAEPATPAAPAKAAIPAKAATPATP
jgi:hypothetical protein